VEAARVAVEDKQGDLGILGIVISTTGRRWPEKKIYYTIDAGLNETSRVTDAIKHWEEKTEIRFFVRTSERNYITFKSGTGCSSKVGMTGGQQFIELGNECSTGNVKHEIGHAVGLWHEHSREDRDNSIEIKWDNIEESQKHNFNQHISDGTDVGKYDFGSIMHYPANAFAKDNTKPTIVTKPSGKLIGQRDALSAGDIATVKSIYP
jgi:hypothetical protein